jgi:hypothetical protein
VNDAAAARFYCRFMASITKGALLMKRMKRINIRRFTLALAFAALVVPAGAQAKPTPSDLPILNGDRVVSSPDDRALSRATSGPAVNLYRSWGPSYTATASPDDRAVSKATSVGVGQSESQEQIGTTNDSGNYPVTAFALVLLAMSGITLIVWRTRKGGGGKLSPA